MSGVVFSPPTPVSRLDACSGHKKYQSYAKKHLLQYIQSITSPINTGRKPDGKENADAHI